MKAEERWCLKITKPGGSENHLRLASLGNGHLVLGYEAPFLPIDHIKQCVRHGIPFLLDRLSDVLVVYERHPITKIIIMNQYRPNAKGK
jgi:hypothetical protein